MTSEELVRQSVLRDMSEGVLTVGLDGAITFINPAAGRILGVEPDALVGRAFAASFIGFEENDSFNQTILDAVYDPTAAHESMVSYFNGIVTRQLHVTTSYLREGPRKIGVIAVLGDISELADLRDAVCAMGRIQALNTQLELRNKLLSETFGRFLSDEIVRQILDTPDGLLLGGKKRTLTILMSDLRGFTAMSEGMEAQDLLSMLNHYLGEMTDIIQANRGTIIEFMGDGILALFGAPAPTETHATDAAVCAVEMARAMTQVNAWNEALGYPALEMGIGVNTGEVIVGNIGSQRRTKYGVVGQHVNLCGRIESYTVGGQVLISPRTRALISAPLTVVGEIEIVPKGVKTPLTISHITGVGAPYNVSCGTEETPPVPLGEPFSVPFFDIQEKHVSGDPGRGTLTALSPCAALLSTGHPLEPYQNLKLALPCGEALCKVLRQQGEAWLVRFTSRPEGFEAWRGGL